MEVVHKMRMICNAIFSIHVSDKKLLAPFIMIVNLLKCWYWRYQLISIVS